MEEARPRWEGKVCAKLTGPTAEQVWPLLEDFTSLHKWLPIVETCYHVEGPLGQPGCTRYCSARSISSKGSQDEPISWAKEKLIAIDPIQRSLSYEITENNIGFNSYVGTMKVLHGDSTGDRDGCQIEWSFVVNPIENWKFEDLISFYYSNLQAMAKRIEDALNASE